MGDEIQKPKDAASKSFLGNIAENFSSKEDGIKWGAVLGTLLTTITGFIFGGGIGGIIGLLGGGLLSGSFNQAADYISNRAGLSDGPSHNIKVDTKSPAKNMSLKIGTADATIPVPDSSAAPDMPTDAVRLAITTREELAKNRKEMSVAEFNQYVSDIKKSESAIEGTLITMRDYKATVDGYEGPKGTRMSVMSSVSEAARTHAADHVLSNANYAALEAFVPHLSDVPNPLKEIGREAILVGKTLPKIKAYDTDRLTKAILAKEYRGDLENAVEGYKKDVDLELVGRRAWERENPGKENEWKDLSTYRKANIALGALEATREKANPDWDKLAQLTGDAGWWRRYFLMSSDVNDKGDAYVIQNKDHKQMLELATKMYYETSPDNAQHRAEIAKVIKYANDSMQIDTLKSAIATDVGFVAGKLNGFAKTTMAADEAAMQDFVNVRMPLLNQTGIAVLERGDLEPSKATNGQPGKYVTYVDLKNPSFGKDGVVTIFNYVENGVSHAGYVDGAKTEISDGILGVVGVNRGKPVSSMAYDMDRVMNLSSPADLRSFAYHAAGITPPEPKKPDTNKAAGWSVLLPQDIAPMGNLPFQDLGDTRVAPAGGSNAPRVTAPATKPLSQPAAPPK